MKYSIDDLFKLVPQAKNFADLCYKLNITATSGNYKTLKLKISKFKLNISHFNSNNYTKKKTILL